MASDILQATLQLALAAAPWLLAGLAVAGLVRALLPQERLQAWLGGSSVGATARGAVAGAPLPLCSCGAIPAALALHRGGAGCGPATAFLIGSPGIGIDSLAISYVLLGPLMAVVRGLGAVVTALATGLLVGAGSLARQTPPDPGPDDVGGDACGGPCGSTCGSTCGTEAAPAPASPGRLAELRGGLAYAFGDILDDIRLWLVLGLLVAGVLLATVPPDALAAYGSGPAVMLLMALVGIPMYLCATAATPIAAGLLVAGVSPGTVLVFLLAAPITSMATLGVYRREMGNAALVRYLVGIVVSTVALGLLLDLALAQTGFDPLTGVEAATEWLPHWLEWAALIALVLAATHPLRVLRRLRAARSA
ncbi:SO_0444 family Cu/Zn efflux transporter [Thioalkalivibrio sp. ALE18]|uniref:SO_0444 family Cu/Zn efflux transporter n=1 Tax=Thioalkalivibrio sp. ALE18 TaxID=1158174 RepID=UPI00037AB2DD|nr:SO_0444 family Cu/Zn efflux transporter [Thioalkalivibrio sp. ALE18]